MRQAICAAAALVFALAAPASELELVQTIELKGKAGSLDHLAIDAKRERLFVANKANNTLDVVDLKSGKLHQQKPNQTAIQGIAYAPDVDRVFVGLGSNGLCNVFNGESYTIVGVVNVGIPKRYSPRYG